MKTHNVVGTSKGYVERVVSSYGAVKVEQVRKYFLSSLKFMKLYLEGETGYTVNKRMEELRKSHRGARQFEVDHLKKVYDRSRILRI